MNKFIIITIVFSLLFSFNTNAQKGYPAPPENDTKEVMDKYQKAVDQWYIENPKEDEKATNSEIATEEIVQGPNLTPNDIPQSAIVWKLSKIEVIESGVIDEQLNEFQQKYINRLNSRKLVIYTDQDKYFYIQKDHDIVKKYAISGIKGDVTLQEYNCPTCKIHSINISNADSNSMVMEKDVKDNKGNKFTVRFSYNKK